MSINKIWLTPERSKVWDTLAGTARSGCVSNTEEGSF